MFAALACALALRLFVYANFNIKYMQNKIGNRVFRFYFSLRSTLLSEQSEGGKVMQSGGTIFPVEC